MQPPPRGCVLKLICMEIEKWKNSAAASARLCVETAKPGSIYSKFMQPPPRGCVLKRDNAFGRLVLNRSRLRAAVCWNSCLFACFLINRWQPPPRGCVLKPWMECFVTWMVNAAASARLCVETSSSFSKHNISCAAASGRLCVETSD